MRNKRNKYIIPLTAAIILCVLSQLFSAYYVYRAYNSADSDEDYERGCAVGYAEGYADGYSAGLESSDEQYSAGYQDGFVSASEILAADAAYIIPENDTVQAVSPENSAPEDSAPEESAPEEPEKPAETEIAAVSGGNDDSPDEESADEIVYVTKSGSKYHLEGCSYLNGGGTAITLSEAESSGYSPCSRCFGG